MRFVINAAVFAAFFCVPPVLEAQSYRVYRPIPRTDFTPSAERPPARMEITVSAVSSLGRIEDGDDMALSRVMHGGRLRILLRLSDYFWAGAEAQLLEAFDKQTAFLTHIRKESFSAVIKWTLTPQTEPKLYLLLSGGVTFNRSAYEFSRHNLDGRSSV